MKTYRLPVNFDSRKFAARYSLNFNTDYYSDGIGGLVVIPNLPDDPPIFDSPDPPLPVTPPGTTFTNGVASRNPEGFVMTRGPDGQAIYTPYYK